MMKTCLDGDFELSTAFESMTMTEAAEIGDSSIIKTSNETPQHNEIGAPVKWALPFQERHLSGAKTGSLKPAGEQDPNDSA
jgi:hypothetical protein